MIVGFGGFPQSALMPRRPADIKGPYVELAEKIRSLMRGRTVDTIANRTNGALSGSTVRRAHDGLRIDEAKLDILAEALSVSPNELRPLLGYPLIAENQDVSVQANANISPEILEIIEYIEDPETRAVVKYFHGLPPEERNRHLGAWDGLRKYRNAGDIARELEEEATVGKRADRKERPTLRE